MRVALLAFIAFMLWGIAVHVKSIDCKVGGVSCHSLDNGTY